MITLYSVVEKYRLRKKIGYNGEGMMIVMAIFCVLLFTLLVLVSGVNPQRSMMSAFELKRRKEMGDKNAIMTLRRERLLNDIASLQDVASALLLVSFVALSVVTFGWFLGMGIAVVVAVEYRAIARLTLTRRQAQRLYDRHEQELLSFVERFAGFFRLIRTVSSSPQPPSHFDSREELKHIIDQSSALLSGDEKKLLLHGLQFKDRRVSEIMTPRGVIDSIDKKELLGPLVLDDLHRTGHSRFPVTDENIDHVIGMLHIHELFALDTKRSVTAEKAMEPTVFYIREDQNLQHALTAFVRTHHHLFIVINEFRETVGIVSLEDVIEVLLGRKIVDEFDMHNDLRAVATRNLRSSNHPEKHIDV